MAMHLLTPNQQRVLVDTARAEASALRRALVALADAAGELPER